MFTFFFITQGFGLFLCTFIYESCVHVGTIKVALPCYCTTLSLHWHYRIRPPQPYPLPACCIPHANSRTVRCNTLMISVLCTSPSLSYLFESVKQFFNIHFLFFAHDNVFYFGIHIHINAQSLNKIIEQKNTMFWACSSNFLLFLHWITVSCFTSW